MLHLHGARGFRHGKHERTLGAGRQGAAGEHGRTRPPSRLSGTGAGWQYRGQGVMISAEHIMQPDTSLTKTASVQIGSLYSELMSRATGLPNDDLFAQIISSQMFGVGALPPCLGLE